jgi:prophage regulatory protein
MTDVYFEGYGVWLVLEDEKASYPISERYPANGLFSLTPRDEIRYRYTGSLNDIDTLRPSDRPDSEFKMMADSGKFDSQLTKHSDVEFYKMERRGLFDDDLEKALQGHKAGKAAEFRELAKFALFHFDKTDKRNKLVLAKPSQSKSTKALSTENALATETESSSGVSITELSKNKESLSKEIAERNGKKEKPNKADKKTPLDAVSEKLEQVTTNNTDLLNGSGLLRLDQIIGNKKKNIPPLIPVGRSTFLQKVKEGVYPQSIKLGARSVAWRTEEIRALVESIKKKENE